MSASSVIDLSIDALGRAGNADDKGVPHLLAECVSPHLRATYKRLTIVTHVAHCSGFEPDEDRLVVCCDWLLWQKLHVRGIDAVFIEAGLEDWDGDQLCEDLFVRTSDWAYIGDCDITEFQGVSLGRQFLRDLHLFLYTYSRVSAALRYLINRFQPSEIELVDMRTEFPILPKSVKLFMVQELAKSNQLKFIDAYEPIDPNDQDFAVGTNCFNIYANLLVTHRPTPNRIYERVLDFISHTFGRFRAPSRRVLVCATPIVLMPILSRLTSKDVGPAILAWRAPKKRDLRFVLDCLRRGVTWVAARPKALASGDRRAIADMKDQLTAAWAAPADDTRLTAMRMFVRERIIDPGHLEVMAREVLACREMMARIKPHRILIDSMENPTARILAAIAKGMGVPTDFTLHGLEIENLKMDIFGCDPRQPSHVDRLLSWGPHSEDWINAIGGDLEIHPIGHPLSATASHNVPTNAWDTALVLQGSPGICSIRGLHQNQYVYFVILIRALNALGVSRVLFKLHPGAWRASYFERIKEHFDLKCDVVVDGNFQDFVRESDFVIGPVSSGAMPETLALGRPYFPIALRPHCADVNSVRRLRAYEHLNALIADLRDRRAPDLQGEIAYLLGDIMPEQPADKLWRSIEESVLAMPRTVETPARTASIS